MEHNEAKELKFTEVNYKFLAFKHPSIFDQNVTEKILHIFRELAVKGTFYLSYDEIQNLYEEVKDKKEKDKDKEYKRFLYMTNWQKKGSDEHDFEKKITEESNKALKDHLRILSTNEYTKQVFMIIQSENKLKEVKKYFLNQVNANLTVQAKDLSREEIINYILDNIKSARYPYNNLIEAKSIFHNITEKFFEANYLLHALESENALIRIPLLHIENDEKVYKDYLFPGRLFKKALDDFINNNLIPSLQERYPDMLSHLRETSIKHQFSINSKEINHENKKNIFQLCFIILESAKENTGISLSDFNLAQLILNSWLALEEDPLLALREYPDIELGNDFLSPFLSKYIEDFSHITEYLKLIKGFLDHLPQLIDLEDLIRFFKTKGVQKKVVESFLDHLPSEILSFNSEKKQYIVAKGQIIQAIYYLFEGKYYKTTETGRQMFEILSEAFSKLEESEKDYNLLLEYLKTTPDNFKRAQEMLSKAGLYRKHHESHDSKDAEAQKEKKGEKILPKPSISKFYTAKDFENLDDEDREKLFQALNLLLIECVDSQNKPHDFYIRKSDLSLEEARFFRGKPTYELICKRFNLPG